MDDSTQEILLEFKTRLYDLNQEELRKIKKLLGEYIDGSPIQRSPQEAPYYAVLEHDLEYIYDCLDFIIINMVP